MPSPTASTMSEGASASDGSHIAAILESTLRSGFRGLVRMCRYRQSPAPEASMVSLPTRWSGSLLIVVAALVVVGCAILHPPGGLPLGTPIEQARSELGGKTGEYPLPGGGTRLEFAQGSFGKQTYMLDFDASGRLVAKQQVLTPAIFATIKPGMTQVEVLSRIARPAFVFPVGWQQLQVWNYRFGGLEGDCVLFQVSISNPTGTVSEAGQGYDPACDGPNTRD